ncbi:MAG: RNA pyrophosphohydrolase [Caulobacter sp.]|nr:RNA pyrophosphohydrolase [Caulobacter sp.]
MSDYPKHRPNVGVVLFHRDGRVWLGRRAKTDGHHSWQFPQGGVDEGEDLKAAALRELEEETGVTSVKLLGRTRGWIVYDFPPEARGAKIAKGWRGQKQVWFAFRFTGKDKEVQLDLHNPPEFDAWRWGRLDETPGLIVPFKRAAYEQVVEAFRQYAGQAMSGSILMIHGVGGTSATFDRLAPAFRAQGWRVEAPTLFADKRTRENPPADLSDLRLKDYVDAMEATARALEAETGQPPVLLGHSMGSLIVQKLAERGLGRAAILLTPASPADARSGSSVSQAFTFANILFGGNLERKGHKIWRTGFNWGVLNRVAQARHAAIYAQAVYDSGGVYADLAYPDRDPHRIGFIDESRIAIPVLTIGGARDRTTPIADVRKVAAKYDRIGGDYLEYPDSGHWLVDEPETDHVISDIAAWLSRKDITADPPAGKPVKARAPARSKAAATPQGKVETARPAAKPAPAKKAPARKAPAKAGASGASAPKSKTATKAKPAAKPKAPARTAASKTAAGSTGKTTGKART